MKKNQFIALLAAVVLPLGFAACSANDNPVDIDPTQPQNDVFIENGRNAPRFFLNAIVTMDNDGDNFESFAWGKELYPETDPGHLYIGVDKWEEAEKMFRYWLAPNVKPGLIPPSEKALKCPLPDENGNEMMQVYLKPGETDDVVAEVTLSDESQMKHFYKITFLKNSAWPTNSDTYKWHVGDVVKNVKITSENNIENKLNDKDKRLDFICIRSSGNGINPWFITVTKHTEYVCGECSIRPTYEKIRKSYYTPNKDTADEMKSIMADNYDLIKNAFDDADCGSYSEGTDFWIDMCHYNSWSMHYFDEYSYKSGSTNGEKSGNDGKFLLNFNNYEDDEVEDNFTAYRSARSKYTGSGSHSDHN